VVPQNCQSLMQTNGQAGCYQTQSGNEDRTYSSCSQDSVSPFWPLPDEFIEWCREGVLWRPPVHVISGTTATHDMCTDCPDQRTRACFWVVCRLTAISNAFRTICFAIRGCIDQPAIHLLSSGSGLRRHRAEKAFSLTGLREILATDHPHAEHQNAAQKRYGSTDATSGHT